MNPAALIILGGGALLLMGGKRKRRKSKTKTPDSGNALPGVKDPDEGSTKPGRDTDTNADPQDDPQVDPQDDPQVDPIPEPQDTYGKPPIGPTGVGSCVNAFYTRDPEYLTPDILTSPKALTLFNEAGYFFYIRRSFQKKLYDYLLDRFNAMKNGQEPGTVASVILRDALKHFNSGCKWEGPIDSLSEPEQIVWNDAHRLVLMAQTTIGVKDSPELFNTGNRFTIPRESVGMPDPGFMNSEKKPGLIGRRVQIIATDKTQENAEHIIGEISKLSGPNGEPNLFEVKIVGTFQGSDVSPQLRTKHGFKVGSNAYFSQTGPTGIYRIFSEGMK